MTMANTNNKAAKASTTATTNTETAQLGKCFGVDIIDINAKSIKAGGGMMINGHCILCVSTIAVTRKEMQTAGEAVAVIIKKRDNSVKKYPLAEAMRSDRDFSNTWLERYTAKAYTPDEAIKLAVRFAGISNLPIDRRTAERREAIEGAANAKAAEKSKATPDERAAKFTKALVKSEGEIPALAALVKAMRDAGPIGKVVAEIAQKAVESAAAAAKAAREAATRAQSAHLIKSCARTRYTYTGEKVSFLSIGRPSPLVGKLRCTLCGRGWQFSGVVFQAWYLKCMVQFFGDGRFKAEPDGSFSGG